MISFGSYEKQGIAIQQISESENDGGYYDSCDVGEGCNTKDVIKTRDYLSKI